MDRIHKNVSVTCCGCGFQFENPIQRNPEIVCPLCGMQLVCPSLPYAHASGTTIPEMVVESRREAHANADPPSKVQPCSVLESPTAVPSLREPRENRKKGWKILLGTVSLQFAVLFFAGLWLSASFETASTLRNTVAQRNATDWKQLFPTQNEKKNDAPLLELTSLSVSTHQINPQNLATLPIDPFKEPHTSASVPAANVAVPEPTVAAPVCKEIESPPMPVVVAPIPEPIATEPVEESLKKTEPASVDVAATHKSVIVDPILEQWEKIEAASIPVSPAPESVVAAPISSAPSSDAWWLLAAIPEFQADPLPADPLSTQSVQPTQPPQPAMEKTSLPESVDPKIRLQQAKNDLKEAKKLVPVDPAKSLELATSAIRVFKELGEPYPSDAYWMMGQGFAAQSWGNPLLENFPPIETLTFSTDGHWMLTSGGDHAVWIWDFLRLHGSGEGFKLDSLDHSFVKLFFAPDLRLAVGGTVDGKIYLWNTTLRNPAESVIVLKNTVQGLRDLQVSPDGRWLVAYGGPPTSMPLVQRKIQDDPVSDSLRRALGNDILLVGHREEIDFRDSGPDTPLRYDMNAVWLWDLQRIQGKEQPQPIVIRGHDKPIRTMTISSDSRWLITGGEDATARIYDLKGECPGADQSVLQGHQYDVTAIAVEPNCRWIATGGRDNTVRLWTLPTSGSPTMAAVLYGHLGWISSLVVDQSGERLISGSYDKTIRIWTIPSGLQTSPSLQPTVIHGDQGAIRRMAVSGDGKRLISLGADSSLRIRSLEGSFDGDHSLVLRNRAFPISQFALTQDDRWLVFSYENTETPANSGIRIWPLQMEELVQQSGELK